MIAPDSQSHSIARVGQAQFAVGLLLSRDLRGDTLDLDMDARFHRRAVLRVPAYLAQGQQFHQRKLNASFGTVSIRFCFGLTETFAYGSNFRFNSAMASPGFLSE